MRTIINVVNLLLWIVVIIYPWLIPSVSSQNAIAAVTPQCMMVIIYGGLLGLDVSIDFCRLTEQQKSRRKILVRYFPFWMIPTVILTIPLAIELIEITLY